MMGFGSVRCTESPGSSAISGLGGCGCNWAPTFEENLFTTVLMKESLFRCGGERLMWGSIPDDLGNAFLFLNQKNRRTPEITTREATTPPTAAPILIEDALFPSAAGDLGGSMPDGVGVAFWLELVPAAVGPRELVEEVRATKTVPRNEEGVLRALSRDPPSLLLVEVVLFVVPLAVVVEDAKVVLV